jgi:hypothetical protein
MGEWSKKIGEQGENIVKYFFEELIGFKDIYRTGVSIPCSYSDQHKKEKAKQRLTHGIDGLVSYNCPLIEELLEIGVISVKYTADKYPSDLKGKFKDWFVELAYTMKCFSNSEEYQNINSTVSDVSDTTVSGLLFWLSNSDEHKEFNILSEISNSTFSGSELVYDKIIVVDNARMNFLFNLIQPIKNIFKEENFDFVYHKTGMNNAITQNLSFGKKLPIQYISADVIPIRLTKGDDVILVIGSRDNFDKNDLLKLIALSKEFNHLEATSKTLISFPDYNKLEHQDIVKSVLAQIENLLYKNQIEVVRHDFDFRNL